MKKKFQKIYSPYAIDYNEGTYIYDPIENMIYSDEQAKLAPKEIQRRLLIKPRKIGAYVMTLEECDYHLSKRETNEE